MLSQLSFPRTLVVACWDQEEEGLVGSVAYAQRAFARGDNIVGSYVFDMLGYRRTEPNSQIPDKTNRLTSFFPEAVAQIAANDYRGDFIAVVAGESSCDDARRIAKYAAAVQLPVVPINVTTKRQYNRFLSDLGRSDHASFWHVDYPGLFLTDTADFRLDSPYHCPKGSKDTIDKIDIPFATKAVQATVGAVAESLGQL